MAKTLIQHETARTVLAALLIELVAVRADTRKYVYHYDLIRLAETAIDSSPGTGLFDCSGTDFVSDGHMLADELRRAYIRAGHKASGYDQFSGVMLDLGPLLRVIGAWGGIGE